MCYRGCLWQLPLLQYLLLVHAKHSYYNTDLVLYAVMALTLVYSLSVKSLALISSPDAKPFIDKFRDFPA